MTQKQARVILLGGFIVVILWATTLVIYWRQPKSVNNQVFSQNPTTGDELFPGGSIRPGGSAPTIPNITASSSEPEGIVSDRSGRFSRLTTRPIGGLIKVGQATSSVIIYAERATGHLYQLGKNSTGPERISDTTMAGIYRLFGGQVDKNNLRVFLQNVKNNEIQTFTASLKVTTDNLGGDFTALNNQLPPLSGNFLTPNLSAIAVSPKQDRVFTLANTPSGVIGYVASLKKINDKEAVFRSPHQEWRAAWPASNFVALSTKPAWNVSGALFLLDLTTKKWEEVMGGVPGLTALLSPRLDRAIYGASDQTGVVFGFYDLKKHFFSRSNVQTWADKCVWGRQGLVVYCAVPTNLPSNYHYPDDWYLGKVNLGDNFWKLNAETGQAEIIFNPGNANLGQDIDADNLVLNDDESKLYLKNRHDGNLWVLNLEAGF